MRTRAPHLSALTGLRFVAAFHVVLLHQFPAASLATMPRWWAGIVHCGYVGVTLFFILSGFILTYSYVDPEGRRPLDRRSFWTARLARVYPVYLFGLLVSSPFFLGWVAAKVGAEGAAGAAKGAIVGGANVALLQAWLPFAATQWNFPGWSLSVEAFFYAVFPLLAPRLLTLRTRTLIWACAGLWLLAWVPSIIYALADPEHLGAVRLEAQTLWLMAVRYNPLFRLPDFTIGICAGLIFLRRRRAGAEWGPRTASAASLAAAATCVALFVADPWLRFHYMRDLMLLPAFALLIYSLAGGSGPLGWLLSRPAAVLLGEASYALYILHIPIALWRDHLVNRGGAVGAQSLLGFVGYALAAVLISVAVLRLLEDPMRRALRARFAGGRRSLPEPASVGALDG